MRKKRSIVIIRDKRDQKKLLLSFRIVFFNFDIPIQLRSLVEGHIRPYFAIMETYENGVFLRLAF